MLFSELVIFLLVVGVLLFVVNKFIPMDAKIKNILNIVVVIVAIVYVLYAFGILPFGDTKVPQVR
jgi:hypothetical protein